MDTLPLPAWTIGLGLVLVILVARRLSTASRPLPPGPQGLPFLGNLLQVPSKLLFLKLVEWADTYGPIYSYNILGQPVIILSGLKEASEILDRTSAKTSDRPRLIKLNDYMCYGMQFGATPANDLWRRHRRAATESLNVRAAPDYQPIQEDEARVLVEGLVNHPEIDAVEHFFRQSFSLGWRAFFGLEPIPLEGPNPAAPLDEFFKETFRAAMPGGSLVDIFRFLDPIISRSKFLRRQSEKFYTEATGFYVSAFSKSEVEERPSMASRLKETGKAIGMDSAIDCGWAVGTVFFAAHDTMTTQVRWFLAAMLLYPETAAAARAQLDSVVGDRPPRFSDHESLPYIAALVKEVLRWRPASPLVLPHLASEDIMYNGYLIPKGAMIVANVWSICRDPSVYADGDAFRPSRFLAPSGALLPTSPETKDDGLGFGFGRRVCVGRDFAQNQLWITFANLLWAFDFESVGAGAGAGAGAAGPDENAFVDNGAVVWPERFGVRMSPRFADLRERLRGEA
ncbi:cytochrome P450 [Calocera cornea HHB12733]|uniref:Cytochrome P450 n=1 Tax=Calocera cornea HHB12733 TaxID=1353952 RepID=A0A165JB03_9BASI|nr:cytochrome P450 [Calocera cornea HHB12733]